MLLLTEGQTSDYKGAAPLVSASLRKGLLADKGYGSHGFHAALVEQGAAPCNPPRNNRKIQHHHGNELYRQRHKIENFCVRIKDWRRVGTRYDSGAHTFMSAFSIASDQLVLPLVIIC
jgi:transposase